MVTFESYGVHFNDNTNYISNTQENQAKSIFYSHFSLPRVNVSLKLKKIMWECFLRNCSDNENDTLYYIDYLDHYIPNMTFHFNMINSLKTAILFIRDHDDNICINKLVNSIHYFNLRDTIYHYCYTSEPNCHYTPARLIYSKLECYLSNIDKLPSHIFIHIFRDILIAIFQAEILCSNNKSLINMSEISITKEIIYYKTDSDIISLWCDNILDFWRSHIALHLRCMEYI